jgi:hypothetical protein
MKRKYIINLGQDVPSGFVCLLHPTTQTRQVADNVELATNEKEMRRRIQFSEAVSQIIFAGNEVYDQGFEGNLVINKMKVYFYVLGTCMDAWKDEFAAKHVAPISSHHKVGGPGEKNADFEAWIEAKCVKRQ